jgi:hypothetical protein
VLQRSGSIAARRASGCTIRHQNRRVARQIAPLARGTTVALDRDVDRLRTEPSLVAPLPRPARVTTPIALPSMRELSSIARNLATAGSLVSAVLQLQHDICKLLRVTDALCLVIDWPHRTVWSTTGQLGGQISELVTDIAGSGKREMLGSTLMQPIGPSPARAVLGLRRPPGSTFDLTEQAMIATLASGIAPSLDRLIAA